MTCFVKLTKQNAHFSLHTFTSHFHFLLKVLQFWKRKEETNCRIQLTIVIILDI
jgi:hypothetical protein